MSFRHRGIRLFRLKTGFSGETPAQSGNPDEICPNDSIYRGTKRPAAGIGFRAGGGVGAALERELMSEGRKWRVSANATGIVVEFNGRVVDRVRHARHGSSKQRLEAYSEDAKAMIERCLSVDARIPFLPDLDHNVFSWLTRAKGHGVT